MKYLKRKYINHLTPGLTFKSNTNYIICVVNNNKVLYSLYGGNETVYSRSQNYDWPKNFYKLVLTDKELLEKFKL